MTSAPQAHAEDPIAYANAVCVRAEGLELQRTGKFQEALAKFRVAEKSFHDTGVPVQVAWTMQHIGMVEEQVGRASHALAMFTGAETLFRHYGERAGFPLMFRRRGDVLRRLHRNDAALATYCEGESLYRTFGDINGIVNTLSGKAAAYLAMHRTVEAHAALSEALWRLSEHPRQTGASDFLLEFRAWQAGLADPAHRADAPGHLARARAIAEAEHLGNDRANPDVIAAMDVLRTLSPSPE